MMGRMVALSLSQLADVQDRVMDHPDYVELRSKADWAWAAKQAADAAFMAAQQAVNELWTTETMAYIEENDL